MRLPVRDLPIPGESLPGYLLRLADYNGWFTAEELLRLVGFRQSVQAISRQEVGHLLAPLLDQSAATILQKLAPPELPYEGHRSLITSMRLRSPRACLSCLASDQQAFVRDEWAILPITHCDIHLAPLVERCPCCGAPLQWRRELFYSCAGCGTSWSDVKQSEVAIPQWQAEFAKIRHDRPALTTWWEDLSKRLMRAARPDDVVLEEIREIPMRFHDFLALISTAYGIESGFKGAEPAGFVTPRRLRYPESLSYHCKFDDLAQALNIPGNEIYPIVEAGHLEPVHRSNVIRDMIFDIRHANNLIASVTVADAPLLDQVEIRPGSQLLKMHNMKYGTMLGVCLKNRQAMSRHPDCGLSVVYVVRHELQAAFNDQLDALEGQLISRHAAHLILQVSISDIPNLLRQGILRSSRSSVTAEQIDSTSVLEMLDSEHPLLDKRTSLIEAMFA